MPVDGFGCKFMWQAPGFSDSGQLLKIPLLTDYRWQAIVFADADSNAVGETVAGPLPPSLTP